MKLLLMAPDVFTKILQLLSPTERAFVARVSRDCRDAVESSGLERAGVGNLPFKAVGFFSSVEMLQWAKTNLCPWGEKLGRLLVKRGSLEVVQWGVEHGSLPESLWDQDSDVCITASNGGNLDVLKYLVQELNLPWWGTHISRFATLGGNVELMQWLRNGGCPFDEFASVFAASVGQVDALRWLKDQGIPFHQQRACARAADYNHLETLQWLREEGGCAWDDKCSHAAAHAGHVELLRWALDNGCPADGLCKVAAHGGQLEALKFARECVYPWDDSTHSASSQAASGGHMEVLRWAVEHGAPMDVRCCACAAAGGHLEILQWLREQGCPCDSSTPSAAAYGGHVHVLRWAQSQGNGITNESAFFCESAAKGGQLDALRWLREYGCPWDEGVCAMAKMRGHAEILRWPRENGAPEASDSSEEDED